MSAFGNLQPRKFDLAISIAARNNRKNGNLMRLVLGILSFLLLASFCNAGEVRVVSQGNAGETNASEQSYRGYRVDLSKVASRADYAKLSDAIRMQIDLIESIDLSPRVRDFFRTVLIMADEEACLDSEVPAVGCYSPRIEWQRNLSVWDSQSSTWTYSDRLQPSVSAVRGGNVVYVRPWLKFEPHEPVLLHEMLHAFHDQVLPDGNQNKGILFHYNSAKRQQLFPGDAYIMRDQAEFFAVTASIFLAGEDKVHEPHTRAKLREKIPEHYKYLVSMFGFDPDNTTGTPVASTN